ncbi:hypothetical protein H9L19_01090 [Weissella diestrammenae]|uniref:YtxH domain-containing protein n=1 Tax=Weissella diestrammenae TaxID=1162633 RepID=A0A7G9T602_9LACO|nr:hypothetical protein [Weissella diestrammenae]MCM0582360.1 hypothetical protein [Weissella diestrammenae]QNN75527.1 hypothetical protein H9L19_01090 [Weissella diestrammenae]
MGKVAKGFAFGALTVGVAAVAAAAYYKTLSPQEQEALQDKFLDGIEAGKEKAVVLTDLTRDQLATLTEKINQIDLSDDSEIKTKLAGFKTNYALLSERAKTLYAEGKQFLQAQNSTNLSVEAQEKLAQIKQSYADLRAQADDLFLNAKDIAVEKSAQLKAKAEEKFGAAQEEFDIVLDSQAAEFEAQLTDDTPENI